MIYFGIWSQIRFILGFVFWFLRGKFRWNLIGSWTRVVFFVSKIYFSTISEPNFVVTSWMIHVHIKIVGGTAGSFECRLNIDFWANSKLTFIGSKFVDFLIISRTRIFPSHLRRNNHRSLQVTFNQTSV